MKHQTSAEQISLIMKKANKSLEAAKKLLPETPDFAISRAYYAVFYAMEAILLTKEMTFSKHTAVISAFNQHFIKTNIFPKNFGETLQNLFNERQIGDYEFEETVTIQQAKEEIENATTIITAIEKYLRENKHDTEST
ncbi:MAG: HEPN domain-containing protein [bacterium]